MKQWFLSRPTARGDLVFLRRWAWALAPLGGLSAWAAWALPDSTVRATMPELMLGLAIAGVVSRLLPEDYTRLRRTGMVYIFSLAIYWLMHNVRWWVLGQ